MKKIIRILTLLSLLVILAMTVIPVSADGNPKPLEYNDFEYYLLDDNTAQIVGYTGTDSTVTVPDNINGYPVISVIGLIKRDNTATTKVIIPESVGYIGEAFLGQNITEIILPDTPIDVYPEVIPMSIQESAYKNNNGFLYLGKHLLGYDIEEIGYSFTYEVKKGTIDVSPGFLSDYLAYGNIDIVLPKSVEKIFAFSFSVEAENICITILNNNVNIEEGAFLSFVDFSSNKNLTIKCYKNSNADKYATSKGIKVIYLDDKEQLQYKFTAGANSVWTKGSKSTLKFTSNGDFSKFKCVKIDDIIIDANNYTATKGSTNIEFTANYLNTLKIGKHKLSIVYSDNEVTTDFEIKAQSTKSPHTYDDITMLIMFLSISAVFVVSNIRLLKNN